MTRRASLAVVLVAALVAGCDGDAADGGSDGNEARSLPACVMKYPRGMQQPAAPGDQIAQAMSECRGDDGECRAQQACQGAPANRQCDATLLISAQAAVCAAEAGGLKPGILATPRTGLVYDFVFRRITWSVSNTMYEGERGERPAAGGGLRGGQSMAVDAITAKLLNSFEWSADM
jgi:hypothetical protein